MGDTSNRTLESFPATGIPDLTERQMVRRTTAEFIKDHVEQPRELERPVFRDNAGFVTGEQAEDIDGQQYEKLYRESVFSGQAHVFTERRLGLRL